jgi:hypothetical protein
MAKFVTTRNITSGNQFSDSIQLQGGFNISLSGTWVATVHVQRSFNKGDTWHDVETWTENTQEYGIEYEEGMYYRVGVKDGNYSSGTVVARLSQ